MSSVKAEPTRCSFCGKAQANTPVRILTLIAEHKKRKEEPGGKPQKGERVAMRTTAILALTNGHWIVPYASGRAHAGNNLGKLLEQRPEEPGTPVQMADALAANFSHGKPVGRAKRVFRLTLCGRVGPVMLALSRTDWKP